MEVVGGRLVVIFDTQSCFDGSQVNLLLFIGGGNLSNVEEAHSKAVRAVCSCTDPLAIQGWRVS